jgi:hypothetical protein
MGHHQQIPSFHFQDASDVILDVTVGLIICWEYVAAPGIMTFF